MLLLLTEMDLFQEIYVLLQLRWTSLSGGNRASLYLGNSYLQRVFLSSSYAIIIGKQKQDAPASNTYISLMRYISFFCITEEAYLKQREPITTLRNPGSMKDLWQKVSHLSQGNHVVHAALSHMDGFLWRDTGISSTQLKDSFSNKWSCLNFENYDLQEVSLSNTNSTLTGKQCARWHASHTDHFLLINSCFSSPYLEKPSWSKERLCPPWNTEIAGSILSKP
jgi:hypothetical protein